MRFTLSWKLIHIKYKVMLLSEIKFIKLGFWDFAMETKQNRSELTDFFYIPIWNNLQKKVTKFNNKRTWSKHQLKFVFWNSPNRIAQTSLHSASRASICMRWTKTLWTFNIVLQAFCLLNLVSIWISKHWLLTTYAPVLFVLMDRNLLGKLFSAMKRLLDI